MAGLLIPLCFVVLVCALGGWRRRCPLGVREAIVVALVAVGVWVVLGSEILSLGSLLRFGPVLAWWVLPTVVLGAMAWRRRAGLGGWLVRTSKPDALTLVLVGATLLILLGTGLVAATTPTNTWDCWTYHLPRQVHWMQNASVAHYPAHDLRQLEMPPMAEMLGLHWMVLSGGDGWANMAQWFALAGCVVAASVVARDLGAGVRGQALAGLLVATIPAVVGQSMSGKNDVVVALWTLCLLGVLARLGARRAWDRPLVAIAGVSLGLLLLTKGTGYIVALPLCVAIGARMLLLDTRRAVPAGAVIAALAVALNAGHWTRNVREFGSPLGVPTSRGGYNLTSECFTPSAIVSNLVRNLTLHTGTPSDRLNQAQDRLVSRLHEELGIGESDPRTTIMASVFPFHVAWTARGDGGAGAPAHLLIAVLLLGVAAVKPRTFAGRWPELAAPYAAFLVFCIVLKWQPWHQRLQIPIVAMLAPLAGAVLPGLPVLTLKRPIVGLAIGLAMFNLLCGENRRLLPPESFLTQGAEELFYKFAPEVPAVWAALEEDLRRLHPEVLGISAAVSSYEYPLLRLARRAGVRRCIPLNPNAGPRDHPLRRLVPDAVIAFGSEAGPVRQQATGQLFLPVIMEGRFTVLAGPTRADLVGHDERPPFLGWRRSTGLGPPMGPMPQFELPVVRWGEEREVELEFDSDGRAMRLVMEARRNDSPDQTMRVLLNGKELYRFDFGAAWEWFPLATALPAVQGPNRVRLEFANCDAAAKRAVQFKKLQIVPAE